MKKLMLTLILVFIAQFSFAQDDAMKKDILKIVEAGGGSAQMNLAKEQILKMVPAEKQAAFLVEFNATLPAFYDKIVKVYMDAYTKEDIKAMLAFYDSPVGKKIAAKAGEIAVNSQTAAQEWGQGLQAMMMKYMQ